MTSAVTGIKKSIPLTPVLVALVLVAALLFAFTYLSRPASKPLDGPASPEAKAYLANLALSDVDMRASENFMKQQVVEVQGKIANNGPRIIASIYVYCLFYGVDGREIYRERLAIVGGPESHVPLKPGDARSFRLPFDSLPDGWNQAMPKLIIAQIAFAS